LIKRASRSRIANLTGRRGDHPLGRRPDPPAALLVFLAGRMASSALWPARLSVAFPPAVQHARLGHLGTETFRARRRHAGGEEAENSRHSRGCDAGQEIGQKTTLRPLSAGRRALAQGSGHPYRRVCRHQSRSRANPDPLAVFQVFDFPPARRIDIAVFKSTLRNR
jgi:hypothetical protein